MAATLDCRTHDAPLYSGSPRIRLTAVHLEPGKGVALDILEALRSVARSLEDGSLDSEAFEVTRTWAWWRIVHHRNAWWRKALAALADGDEGYLQGPAVWEGGALTEDLRSTLQQTLIAFFRGPDDPLRRFLMSVGESETRGIAPCSPQTWFFSARSNFWSYLRRSAGASSKLFLEEYRLYDSVRVALRRICATYGLTELQDTLETWSSEKTDAWLNDRTRHLPRAASAPVPRFVLDGEHRRLEEELARGTILLRREARGWSGTQAVRDTFDLLGARHGALHPLPAALLYAISIRALRDTMNGTEPPSDAGGRDVDDE